MNVIKLWWCKNKLNSASVDVRVSAVVQLGKLGDLRAIEPLIKTVSDKEKVVRYRSAEALALLGQKKWLDCIRGDNDDFIRLGKSGDSRLFNPFVKHLWKMDDELQCAIINALGELGDVRAISHLELLVANKNLNLRLTSAEALSKLGHPEWLQWIRGDEDDFMRLGESGESKVVDPLIQAAISGNNFAEDAIVNLGKIAIKPLIWVWETTSSEQNRFTFARILSRLGDDRGVARLCNSLSDRSDDARYRQATARVLAKIGGPHAILCFTETLDKDFDVGVRQIASEALAKFKLDQRETPEPLENSPINQVYNSSLDKTTGDEVPIGEIASFGESSKPNQYSGDTKVEQYALCLSSTELQDIISGSFLPDPPRGYQEKVQIPIEVAEWAIPVVEALETADSFANRGDLDLAFILYTDILKSGIHCGVAAMSASFCCFHQNKWDLALKYIKMAEEYDPISTRIKENVEYIIAECANQDDYEAEKDTSQKLAESGKVRMVEKKQLPGLLIGYDTYEVYQADTAEDASEFLNGRNIVEQQYYLIVETPKGIFGKDKMGIYTPSKNWRGDDWNKY